MGSKRLKVSLLLLLFFSPLLAEESISYKITQNPYGFSTYFEMEGEEHYEGRLIKAWPQVRTTYDLYDHLGNYEGQGICRAASLGVIYTWAKEIDIYDHDGNKIGFIDGKAWTTASAKYNFYGKEGKLAYIAYLDRRASAFTLVDPSPKERTLGRFSRNTILGAPDHWDVTIFDVEHVDLRILKIFSAFILDYQDSFKPDV